MRSPASLKSTCAVKKVADLTLSASPFRLEVSERRRERGPGDAIADRMHRFDAEQIADGVDRVDLAPQHIIVEARIGDALVGRFPADHEQRDALVDAPFDEAFLGREVEDVEAVDPRREDHDRRLQHFVSRRRVLDQLIKRRLPDDLAGRRREVSPDLEHAGLGLRHLPRRNVLQHIGEALEQILAARIERPLRAPADWSARSSTGSSHRRSCASRSATSRASPDRRLSISSTVPSSWSDTRK